MEDRTEETFIEQELESGIRFPMGKEGTLWRILEIDDRGYADLPKAVSSGL